jgi:hypothetical protein
MPPEYRGHTDSAEGARHDLRRRLSVVGDFRIVVGAGPEQQFIGVERALSIEDRLAAKIDELGRGRPLGILAGRVTRLDAPGSGTDQMKFRHGSSVQLVGVWRGSGAPPPHKGFAVLTDAGSPHFNPIAGTPGHGGPPCLTKFFPFAG